MEANAVFESESLESSILKSSRASRDWVGLRDSILVEERRLVALHVLVDLLEEQPLEAAPRNNLRMAIVQAGAIAHHFWALEATRPYMRVYIQ